MTPRTRVPPPYQNFPRRVEKHSRANKSVTSNRVREAPLGKSRPTPHFSDEAAEAQETKDTPQVTQQGKSREALGQAGLSSLPSIPQ